MKTKIITLVIALISASALTLSAQSGYISQRVGYINTDSILVRIPEYNKAIRELDKLNEQYQTSIKNELSKIETLYKTYQSQKSRLSESEKAKKEQEIIDKEKKLKELQQTYFGPEGYLTKKTSELLDPIKADVQDAIDFIARENRFMIILDIAAMQGVAYSDPDSNLNQYILKYMGY